MIEINGHKIDPQHYIDKWIKWALEPTLATDNEVTENVQWLYKNAGLKKPKVVIFREWEEFMKYDWTSVASVGTSLMTSVRASVEASVRASVASVRASVMASVASVEASVGTSVGAWYWADDLAFADVFTDTKVLDEKKVLELEKYKKVLSSQRLAIYTDDVCYVLVAPVIRRNEEGKLNSESSPSCQWGKTGLYYLNGVSFEKGLWESIVNKTISTKEAISLENQEQKTIAMRFVGGDKLFCDLGGKVRSKDKYGELIELDYKDVNNDNVVYYRSLDPSKNEYIYLLTDPKVETPQEAMTKAYKLQVFNLTYKPSLRT